MDESTWSSSLSLGGAIRRAWAAEGAAPDVRQWLTPEVLDSPDLLLEVISTDAEERWARGIEARIEFYDDLVPDLASRAPVCQALLMFELVRRDDKHSQDVRDRLKDRVGAFARHVDMVVDLYELVGSEVDQEFTETKLDEGAQLGKYRLEIPLGRGSFGEVWQAWDVELERHVALKVLNDPVSARESDAIERVLREAQASASLDHENVVTVHAAGRLHDSGQLYIDSQLVGDPTPDDAKAVRVGTSLDAWRAEQHALSARDACAIMEQVCAGVAAAHARGITHRDLKPANILITPSGKPMVADFGLSVSGVPVREQAGAHETGSFDGGSVVGTPLYMSPEQARGEPVTPLSDVYALGATLRFLLTGEHPYKASGRFDTDARRDVLEQVKRAENARPLPDTVPSAVRAICKKATQADPGDRYVSAAQLGEDLAAYLSDRPTLAESPGQRVRVGLWLRRNSAIAAVVAVSLAVIVIGTAVYIQSVLSERDDALAAETTARDAEIRASAAAADAEEARTVAVAQRDRALQAEQRATAAAQDASTARTQAEADRDRALRAEQDAQRQAREAQLAREAELEQRLLAESALDEAQLEAAKASAVTEFLATMLGSADPTKSGASVTVVEVLDNASDRVESEFADQPEVRLVVRQTIGVAYTNLGQYDKAEPHLKSALEDARTLYGDESFETAAALHDMGMLLFERAQFDEAETLIREALATRELLTQREGRSEGSSEVVYSLVNLAGVAYQKGDPATAEELTRRALDIAEDVIGSESSEVATCVNNLGGMLYIQGRYDEAEPYYWRALELNRHIHGEQSQQAGTTLNNLGQFCVKRGDYEQALLLHLESLEIRRGVYPEAHPAIAVSLNNVGLTLDALGRHEEGLEYHREALEIRRQSLPPGHPAIAVSFANLAHVLGTLGQWDESEAFAREALEMRIAAYGEDHARVGYSWMELARVLQFRGQLDEAEQAARKSLAVSEAALGPDHQQTADAMQRLGRILLLRSNWEEAEKVLSRCLESRRASHDDTYMPLIMAQSELGEALVGLGRFDDAEPLLVEAWGMVDVSERASDGNRREVLERLVNLYAAWGRPNESARFQQMLPPPDDAP